MGWGDRLRVAYHRATLLLDLDLLRISGWVLAVEALTQKHGIDGIYLALIELYLLV